MTAKVCPRCGSQYENFKSTTCPQCFAILVAVDEATAEEMAAARAEVERSPEFQQAKTADDERFREQSFGACLGIAALTLATVALVIVLLVSAAHRRTARHFRQTAPKVASARLEPLTTLPVAAAALDDVLPPTIAPYSRQSCDAAGRTDRDVDPALSRRLRRALPKTIGCLCPAGQPAYDRAKRISIRCHAGRSGRRHCPSDSVLCHGILALRRSRRSRRQRCPRRIPGCTGGAFWVYYGKTLRNRLL